MAELAAILLVACCVLFALAAWLWDEWADTRQRLRAATAERDTALAERDALRRRFLAPPPPERVGPRWLLPSTPYVRPPWPTLSD